MDQATLQAKVAKGYGIAATKLGAVAQQYRPTSLSSPLSPAYAACMAAFNNDPGFSFREPTPWGKPMVFGLFDTTDIREGDLLICGPDTYFVARFSPYRPPLCVLCNNAVSLQSGQSGSSGAVGSDDGTCTLGGYQSGYGDESVGASTPDLTAPWPCYLGLKGPGRTADSGLPGALTASEFLLLLPIMPNFTPMPYMTFSDMDGVSYTISGVERSSYGYRCAASIQQI